MSKELEKALKVQQRTGKVDSMLERDTNRRNKGRGRLGTRAHTLRSNPLTYPPELFAKYGEAALYLSGGYAYAHINGKSISLARMVYALHHPDYDFTTNQKVFHIDGDKLNNTVQNLTVIREEAQGV